MSIFLPILILSFPTICKIITFKVEKNALFVLAQGGTVFWGRKNQGCHADNNGRTDDNGRTIRQWPLGRP
jgi:hypothetical protein